MSRRRQWLVRAAAGLVAVIAGCSQSEDASGLFGPASGCTSDLECPSNALCMNLVCVGRGSISLDRAHLEIRPPVDAPYVRHQRVDQSLDAINGGRISLPQPVTFDYSIRDDAGTAIAARLHIVGTDRISGRERDVLQGYAPNNPSQFRVEPGTYDVRIVPTESERPGLALEGLVVRASVAPIIKEFRLPPTRRRIVGSVRQRTASNIPVEGVRVRATSRPSGLPSSSAVTLGDGLFEIELPETTDTTFEVVAEVDAATAASWRFEQVIQVFTDDTRRVLSIPFEPTSDQMRTMARIRVIGFGASGPEAVPAAALTFTASTAPATKVFETSAITDKDGFVVVETDTGEQPLDLVAARYTVDIDPPAGSRMARTTVSLDLSSVSPGVVPDRQLEVEPRVRVSGAVTSASGQAAPTVQVHFERLDSAVSRITALTDIEGRYAVWLDPGSHLVRVDPTGAGPIGEALAAGFRNIDVGHAASIELPALTLPPPVAFEGTVVGAQEEPVAKSAVEVFVEAEGRVISVGRAVTDGAGAFRMVVPGRDGGRLSGGG